MYTGTQQVAHTDLRLGTIRHVNCEKVIPVSMKSTRCKTCVDFRACLRVKSNRLCLKAANRTNADSHVPYHALSRDEMQSRMKSLHDELRRIKKQRYWLKEKLEALTEKEGIVVNESMNEDLRKIIEEEGKEKNEHNFFQRVFWQQQAEAASKKDHRGMKWHPAMIKWCLYL